jgi:hypothetical protein
LDADFRSGERGDLLPVVKPVLAARMSFGGDVSALTGGSRSAGTDSTPLPSRLDSRLRDSVAAPANAVVTEPDVNDSKTADTGRG